MASTMTDFLSAYLNIDQMQRARRAQEVQEVSQRAQQIGAAQQILSTTSDPSKQEELIKFFGPMLGETGEDMMRQIAASTSPTVETTKSRIVSENVGNLPQGAGQDITLSALGGTSRGGVAQSGALEGLLSQDIPENIQKAWLSRTFAGMDPGALAVSELIAGSPEAQRMQTGQELTAQQQVGAAQGWEGLNLQRRGQTLQNELGWAGNRLGWSQLLSNSALGEARIAADLQKAQQTAAAKGDQNALGLLEEIGNIEKLIQQGNMNRDAIARNMTLMKDYYRRLVEMGYEQFRPMAEMDVSESTRNTFVPGFGYRFFGQRGPGNW